MIVQAVQYPRSIYIGEKSLTKLQQTLKQLNTTNPLFIMSQTLAKSPYVQETINKLPYETSTFTNFQGEPNTNHLTLATDHFQQKQCDSIVAIGGGSAIDLAKAVSYQTLNPSMKLTEIPNQDHIPRVPLIAVPTTAGTGSEATKITVITDETSQIKMNPAHHDLTPDVAILDPLLTTSLPQHITAYTGIDALAHAMEAYVSTLASDLTDDYALKAIRLIGEYLPIAVHQPESIEAREKMLKGSLYAGIAFSNASTNLAHATARPLGARFKIPHGLSVALTLSQVVKFGLQSTEQRYANIASALHQDPLKTDAQDTYQFIEDLNDTFNIYELAQTYIQHDFQDDIPQLTEDALSGNGIKTNRKLPTTSDIQKIYYQINKNLGVIKWQK
ncbi:alcohol dehydrogenase class IV [Alkalibacillus filiformis]|uniref:Alcohol dehydrogenase class IV n=1 Tax=Alkalibacillus filiformis TaxID=200990 RepID=A0ABU0DV81_9BACI|nr:iron-containing alcohol dehydrogenase [Alkalibacillus filiformis]MDQ0352362.1 alcohol dehydrogenase class IV [Alkalibacillus filiformis]